MTRPYEMQRVVSSSSSGARLLLVLECGHTMDAANPADKVPCFECGREVSEMILKSTKIEVRP